MKRPVTAAKAAPISLREVCAQPARERRLRQWACKIVSDLPTDTAEALLCLEYAEALVKAWVDLGAVPKVKGGRVAR